MKIVTLYQPQFTDGYTDFPMDVYFDNNEEANIYAKVNHGSYSVNCKPVKAICEEGEFYILQQEAPVYLHNSDLDKEKRKQELLDKLSQDERELLGV